MDTEDANFRESKADRRKQGLRREFSRIESEDLGRIMMEEVPHRLRRIRDTESFNQIVDLGNFRGGAI